MRLFVLLLSLALSACAHVEKPASPLQKKQETGAPLSELSADFLYLAAQDAVNRGKAELAIRLLGALLAKDADAAAPRLLLAELLLRKGRAKDAKAHIEILLRREKLEHKLRDRASVLDATALAALGKRKQALVALDALLAKKPALLPARLLQIRIYIQMGNLTAAHLAIRQGLTHKKTAALYRIQAQLFVRQGRLEEGEDSLLTMQKLVPHDEFPVLMLSRLAMQRGKAGRAERFLRDFLKGHPNALRVSNALGRLLIAQNRTDEAIGIYEELAAKTGETPEVMAALGMLYYQKKQYARAAAQFRKALAKRPNSTNRYYLAASLEADKKDEEAFKLYAQIQQGQPFYTSAQLRLAAREFMKGRRQAAASRLLKLIRFKPDAGDAYTMLSGVRLSQKRYTLLLKETGPALKLARIPVRLLFNRAAAFERLKQYEQAEESLKKLLAIRSDDADALNFLGYMYADRGIRLDEAEKLIRRALKQKPNDGYYVDSLAWVYFKRGQFEKALKLQKKALGQVKDDPVMHEHMGDILWKLGQADAARKAWQRALKFQHERPAAVRKKISRGL